VSAATPQAQTPTFPAVHVLVVHGVGGHDHLSNLLRTYQSFRSNLRSVEAPVPREDQIPFWRLTKFEEGATPPVLTLEPRDTPMDGGTGSVCFYEVNYSGFAGVIRRNHPIDLTDLFLGLDLSVCAARLRERKAASSVLGGDTKALGGCLQRVAGVLAAGTVPILGLPALLFRNYIGTFIALFTRFFEDVATFVLDKNGEQLIAAHLDRTMQRIGDNYKAGDRVVIAAHSLGSVVVHNYVARMWTAGKPGGEFPNTVITFGSPIGLLMWVWLYLDFDDMDFRRVVQYPTLCWGPVSKGTHPRTPLTWINVVNCVDPIATAFPLEVLDLSDTAAQLSSALTGGDIEHRYFGADSLGSVGASHSEYLHDKRGFIPILLRAAGLEPGPATAVASQRSAAQHWLASRDVLFLLQCGLFGLAVAAMAGYCWFVARAVGDARAYAFVLSAWPPAVMHTLAFFQRLLLGGPTKRITPELIRGMRWSDVVSFPYRFRDLLVRPKPVDPMAPSRGYVARLLINVLSFIPTAAGMAVPFIVMAWATGQWLPWRELLARLWTVQTLLLLGVFMVFVVACALHELVRTWRRVIQLLT
jgi:hypothetical protein